MSEQISPIFSRIVVAVALTNILVCVLANMLVATRLLYSMARDNMTPFARLLSRVSDQHKTPTTAVWVTGGISLLFVLTSFLSTAAFAYIVGMCALGYFAVYVLTTAGLIRADRRGQFPAPTPGAFDLGTRRRPVHVLGLVVFAAIMVALLVLPAYRSHAIAFALVFAVALLWWVFPLRNRIRAGHAGPASRRAPSPEPASDEALRTDLDGSTSR
jgi:amino acid transporter